MAIDSDYSREGRTVSWRRAASGSLSAALLAAVTLLAVLPAVGQYPEESTSAKKSTPDLRAVAVLEWTGEAGHPTASRLIPISVFDGQQLQDGDIYLARPQPLALDPDVEYELKRDGKTVGLYDIHGAQQVHGAWVGYGVWKPLPTAKPKTELAHTRIRDFGGDSGRPILHRSPEAENTSSPGNASSPGKASGGQTPPADEGGPTLHRTDTGDDSGNPGPDNSNPNLNRPTLHRTSDDSASTAPAEDSGRPTLRKEKKDKGKEKQQDSYNQAYVETVPQIFDPGRPQLLAGKPKSPFGGGSDLAGIPEDMHQEIAVSDASNTPDHLWNFSWANPDDADQMKTALEEIARKDLALIPSTASPAPAPPAPLPEEIRRPPLIPPPAPSAAAAKSAPARKRERPVRHRAAETAPPPPAPLVDEQFHVFRLAYDSGATMVFSAHTAATDAAEKYITLIAQPDLYGHVRVLFKSITDAGHLDLTPRMRLVGPVDAMADNRGELLFELRGATQRQFALYRVYGGQVTQLLVTGGGSFVSEAQD